jgi:hypothetical integral membrane protein (TIGR02206 family)
MSELHYEVMVNDGMRRQHDQRIPDGSPITLSRLGGRRAMSYVIATLVIVAAAADFATIPATRQFSTYGPSHLTVLMVFAIGSAALVWIGRRQTQSQARLLRRVLGALTMAIFSVALLYKLVQPTISQSVPLQLCDLAELTAAYALWSQRKWAFTLTYYWGLPLSSQALLTPDLHGPDFPSHGFLTFFALHLLIVWAAIYLTWGIGMRPNWRNYRFAVITTLAWGAFTLLFNTIAGTDYGFLNRKPVNASMLDFLGPWPFYVLAEVAIVGAVWALMTWPWELKRRRPDGCKQALMGTSADHIITAPRDALGHRDLQRSRPITKGWC